MNTEEKAKAYDEALEKAKTLKECSTNTEVLGYMDELFPELKESTFEWSEKDEEILQSIIWHLRNSLNNCKQPLSGGELEVWLRTLKKRCNKD